MEDAIDKDVDGYVCVRVCMLELCNRPDGCKRCRAHAQVIAGKGAHISWLQAMKAMIFMARVKQVNLLTSSTVGQIT